ncbi:hypothetical protein ATANTOWER_007388 [Ataeniobius toweri]|uniref:Uncharacterized protein n=1 Tax=Ataeniobius toweri TaxID=208326 RepID=A0ABU7AZ78_9TELE|nr:hypothetical protein [Ataeniobius toweri]
MNRVVCVISLQIQDSHQSRSGRCGQKEEEIALNLEVLMPCYCPSPYPGGEVVCRKIGGPLRCLMAFIDSHQTLNLPFTERYAVQAFWIVPKPQRVLLCLKLKLL